jgi:gentisate 1,2-dioxygenase
MVEGKGAVTVVGGEKLPMTSGDVVLTPGGEWHEHSHDGAEPVVWLDALDLPVFVQLEASYAEEGRVQTAARPVASEAEYRSAGLVPSRGSARRTRRFPLLRYPWERTEATLRNLARDAGSESIAVDFVNPETGEDPLPTIGFTALLVRPGETVRLPIRSSNAVFHVVQGAGRTRIEGDTFHWHSKDTFSAPGFVRIEHTAQDSEAFLIEVHDRPLQQRLGFYEERNA